MTIIEKLWEQLDEQIALAVPLQRKIKDLQKNEPGDDVGLLELEVEKYKTAGFAPGLAQALCTLLDPLYPDYKAVVKHAQLRYKAVQAGEPMPETPRVPPGREPKPSMAEKAIADGEDETVAEHEQAVADSVMADEIAPEEQAAPEPEKPKRRRQRDPGPSVDDIEPDPADEAQAEAPPKVAHRAANDPNLEQLRRKDPEAYKRVVAALEKVQKDTESRQSSRRPDETDEEQDALHSEELPEAEQTSEEFEAGGEEQTPDDVAAMLAALEEE